MPVARVSGGVGDGDLIILLLTDRVKGGIVVTVEKVAISSTYRCDGNA